MSDTKEVIVIEKSTEKVLAEATIDFPSHSFAISIDKPPFNLPDYELVGMDNDGDKVVLFAELIKK